MRTQWMMLALSALAILLSSCLFDTAVEESNQLRVHYRLEVSEDSVDGLDSVSFVVNSSSRNITIQNGSCPADSIQKNKGYWVCRLDFLVNEGESIQIEYTGFWKNSEVIHGKTSFHADVDSPGTQAHVSFASISSENVEYSSEELSSPESSSHIRTSSSIQASCQTTLISSAILSSSITISSANKSSSSSRLSSSNNASSSSAVIVPVQLVMSVVGEGTIEGNRAYLKGDWASINAMPDAGYHFYRWGGKDSSHVENISSASTRISMKDNYTLVAIFKKKWTVKVAQDGLGTLVPSADTYQVWDGEQFILNGSPASGYILDSIRGTQKSATAPLSWIVSHDDSVHVKFGKVEWSKASTPTSTTIAWDMAFNASEANSVGMVVAGYQGSPEIWKTINKGNSWSQVVVPVAQESINYESISYESNGNAFYIGGGLLQSGYCAPIIWKTSDNGSSWTSVGVTGIPANVCIEHIAFMSSTDGYVGTTDGLYYTQDGGSTWSKLIGEAVRSMVMTDNAEILTTSGIWEYTQTIYRARKIKNGVVQEMTNITSISADPGWFFFSKSLDRYVLSGDITSASFALSQGNAIESGWVTPKCGYWELHYMQENSSSSDVIMLGFEFGMQSVKVATFALDHQTVTSWRTSFMPKPGILFKGMHEFSDGTIVALGSRAEVYVRSP